MKNKFANTSTLALITCLGTLCIDQGSQAWAQDQSSASVSEVIVTGTRQTGVKAADSAAPIEVVGSTALKQTGYNDLADALAASVPSLNVEQNGGDAAALVVQAALRGLNPNDTLVLVDGKRRNTTADLAVDGGSAYSGSAAVDLSFIPVAAIDHVEVLTDGAAAQYGSDAIAGVVNIILKKSASGGSVSATGGQYYEGDGDTGAWSINKGFSLGDKGFANVTVEERYHDFSEQGFGDRRYTNADGSLASGNDAATVAGVQNAPGYPDENKLNGDPAYNVYNVFYNAGYDLGDGVQAYAFGSYGNRIASHYENYRPPEKVEGTTSTGETVLPFPDGFEPREQIKEQEFSFTEGVKGKVFGWNWDLSTVYGEDNDQVYTINSGNDSLFPVLQALSSTPITAQTNFYDGAYISTELTNTLDLDRSFAVGLASPLNVAFGFEQRRDTYEIAEGEPSSYYGSGAQSFIGYTPNDQGTHSRTNYAVYGDLAADPIAHWSVDLAGRYENYSDFGGATVGKITSRYDFTSNFAVRGTLSTGFRAPTLAEEYYSGTNVSPDSADVQLPPNSSASSQAGFGKLKPETSHNYSVGIVYHPIPRIQITADAYDIIIHNRILVSGFLFGEEEGYGSNGVVSQGVLNAISARGVTLDSGLSYAGISIFSNAANTRTDGAELTATYSSDFDQFGHVDWSLGFNYNQNAVTKLFPLPSAVTNADFGQTSFLDKAALSALTNSTPQEKAVLQAYWTLGQWSVNLRETIYGPSSEWVSYDGSGTGAGAFDEQIGVTGITDLDIGYKITKSLKLDIGANNLFNTYPPLTSTVGGRPTDGGYVFNVPYAFAPWGNNGGYYYGRVTYTF
jgi:iron complex outermembrane receptor protein